ncbi:MAG: glutathione S-transferase family protein [Sandaracinaceae bacterium]|nr:glutathione S-transferase family protein [Sandaracinaceae bacterium]
MTVQLYAIPFACSLAAHLALREGGIPFDITWVSRDPNSEGRRALAAVEPKGKVAVLVTSDGRVISENAAVLHYIERVGTWADAPDLDAQLARLAWLSYIGTELHKQVLATHFDFAAPQVSKADVVARHLPRVLAHLDATLARTPFLTGQGLTVADTYLFWALVLVPQLGVRRSAYPALARFWGALNERPSVVQTLAAEREAYERTKDDAAS